MAFADQMRATGYAVESILTALHQAGLKIAARTLRAWSAPAGPANRAAARTVTDALVEDAVRRRQSVSWPSPPAPPVSVCWLPKVSMAGAKC